MGDLAARNIELVRDGYEAFGRGDLETVQRLFAPDAVWRVQRLGLLSGDHEGWPAVAAFFVETMQLTAGTFRVTPIDIMASETRVAVYARSTASRDGRSLDDLQIHLFTLEGEVVAEVRQFVGDADATQEFWS